MWVIKKGNEYVALPGSEKSYTKDIKRAQRFTRLETAQANACSNEHVVALHLVWGEE